MFSTLKTILILSIEQFLCILLIVFATILSIFPIDTKGIYFFGSKIIARVVLLLLGVKVNITLKENLKKVPAIYASNYQSRLDGLLLLASLPYRFRIIAGERIFGSPIEGFIYKKMGFILLSEKTHPISMGLKVKEIVEIIKSGESILIFPEGKTSRDGRLLPFAPGTAWIALSSKESIIPVIIDGSYRLRSERGFKGGKVKIKIGSPLDTKYMGEPDQNKAKILTAKLHQIMSDILSSK